MNRAQAPGRLLICPYYILTFTFLSAAAFLLPFPIYINVSLELFRHLSYPPVCFDTYIEHCSITAFSHLKPILALPAARLAIRAFIGISVMKFLSMLYVAAIGLVATVSAIPVRPKYVNSHKDARL